MVEAKLLVRMERDANTDKRTLLVSRSYLIGQKHYDQFLSDKWR